MIDKELTINRVKSGDIVRYIHRSTNNMFRVVSTPEPARPGYLRIRIIEDDGSEAEGSGSAYPVLDFNNNFRKVSNPGKEIIDVIHVILGQALAFGFIDEAQALLLEMEI